MFTGLIEDIGVVSSRTRAGDDVTLTLSTAIPTPELVLGESIAVNGVCLTVTTIGEGTFTADASTETLARSVEETAAAAARKAREEADAYAAAIANPPEPRPEPEPRPPTEITSRSTIEHLDDGTCIEHLSVDCPPGMACNPPPPREVPCPEPARPDATVVDNVHKRPDGSCWESYEVECPPGARCNPPAPRRVNCPPDVE